MGGTYTASGNAPVVITLNLYTDATKTVGKSWSDIAASWLAELRPAGSPQITNPAATFAIATTAASGATPGKLTLTLTQAQTQTLLGSQPSASFGWDLFETVNGNPIITGNTLILRNTYTHPSGTSSPAGSTPVGSFDVVYGGSITTNAVTVDVFKGDKGDTGPAGAPGTGAVSSVNGKTGAVTLTASDVSAVPTSRTVAGHALTADVTLAKADVGLGSVDNTADVDKPVSTAQQTALDAKANTADVPVNLTDLGGKLGYQQMGAGAVLTVDFTSSNYTTVTRPNVATGVRVWWIGDATTSPSTLPVNAVTGDIIDTAS